MRTTLTLEDDLVQALKARAREEGAAFKDVVNEVIRRGLAVGEKPDSQAHPFVVKPFSRGFKPGVDPLRLNQLVDELEAESFLDADHGRQRDRS